MLSLFQFQVFYLNEVKRGLAGLGEYTLLPEFCDLHESFVQPYEGRSPQEIVQSIRDRQNTTDEEKVAIYVHNDYCASHINNHYLL